MGFSLTRHCTLGALPWEPYPLRSSIPGQVTEVLRPCATRASIIYFVARAQVAMAADCQRSIEI